MDQHFSNEERFVVKVGEFRLMVDQVAAAMNFQHGETYLSAASDTAVRYAVNKRVGSELISYTLDFLQELLRHRVPGIRDDLYKEYPLVFNLLNISAAPILVELTSVSTEDLAAEDGGDATSTLECIRKVVEDPEMPSELLQQSNFRLRRAVPAAGLRMWLINVTKWHPFASEYTLYELPAKAGRRAAA